MKERNIFTGYCVALETNARKKENHAKVQID